MCLVRQAPDHPLLKIYNCHFYLSIFFCQNELFATHLLEHKLSWEICLLEDCKIVQLKTFTILWGGKSVLCFFFNIIIAKCLWELSYLRIIKFCICMGILAHCTSRFSSSKYKDIFNSGKQAVPFLPLFLSLHLQCQGLKQGPHCNSTAELHPQPFSLSLHVSV